MQKNGKRKKGNFSLWLLILFFTNANDFIFDPFQFQNNNMLISQVYKQSQ
jgi:hypothetical protein